MNAQEFIDGTYEERPIETANEWGKAFFPNLSEVRT